MKSTGEAVMSNSETSPGSKPKITPEERVLVHGVRMLWKNRKRIFVITILFGVVGVIRALIAAPVYYAEAVIVPKERDPMGGASRLLSQIPGAGGLVNSGLERTAMVLKSRELSEAVVLENDLLPLLYPDAWDEQSNSWKDPEEMPDYRWGADRLRNSRLSVGVDTRIGVITLGMTASDSLLAKRMVDLYLAGLHERMREDAVRDAEADRRFLEKELAGTSDPVLRDKLLDMIAFQIEKAMLASTQAFQVIEKPMVPILRAHPKRKQIVMMFLFVGFFLSCLGVLLKGRVSMLWSELKNG